MFHKQKNTGFTLIELMLAMTFVAFILVFVSLTLVQMFRTYNKGVAMKGINQAGSAIVNDISNTVRSQLPSNVNVSNVASGALCIGNVMYLWNPLYTGTTAGSLKPRTPASNYDPVIGTTTNGGMMAREILTNPNPASPCDGTQPTSPQKSVLLGNDARVLRSSVKRVGTDKRLVQLSFVIGTYARNEFIPTSTTKYMTPTQDNNGNFSCLPGDDGNYCAFAEFDTVVYIAKE